MEKYKKLTQLEHIKLRPGMYIGNTDPITELTYVPGDDPSKFSLEYFTYNPGFLKIFDEIISNAIDHSTLHSVTNIKVTVTETGTVPSVTVYNDGPGIPTGIHPDYGIHVPELIFGNLLSGSNYSESPEQSKAVIGTFGLGAKLTNVFSSSFVVETVCDGSKYIQAFTEGMTKKTKPKITKTTKKDYTKISFVPNPELHFNDRVIEKRVIEASVNTTAKVSLNGVRVKINTFKDYVNAINVSHSATVFHGTATENWEYAVLVYTETSEAPDTAFVNSANCNFGKHIDCIYAAVVPKLKLLFKKKYDRNVTSAQLKEFLQVVAKVNVNSPKFNSQTKETLVSLGKTALPQVPDTLVKKVFDSLKGLLPEPPVKETKKQKKVIVPKLEDAIHAGKHTDCSLILTEGDSAKTFAVWGRTVTGPEKYGVFPLKGKLINVNSATKTQLANNSEIANLTKIIGLTPGIKYKDTNSLRYSKVILLTDADVDGSHIAGLVMNFFYKHYPELLDLNFIQKIKTPIIKLTQPRAKAPIEFFTEKDYQDYAKTHETKSAQIKYYKGLGTSRKEDAKDTFTKLKDLTVNYTCTPDTPGSLDLAFGKETSSAAQRKIWLSNFNPETAVLPNTKNITFTDFVNKDLIHFSIYDNKRSIPDAIDGMKPSQRKIIHWVLKNNTTKSIKVAQMSGYVSAETGYHHGEVSLQQAIIHLAQNFIGTNNINLLYPDGNFGSRLSGKDAASPRYIYTRMEDYTQTIFDKRDTPNLKFLFEENQKIEPDYFVPIIPMVLVNGAEGIGTGYSTSVPPHDPLKIIQALQSRLTTPNAPVPIVPSFRGHRGKVTLTENGYTVSGVYTVTGNKVIVTELPVTTSVTGFKEHLDQLGFNYTNYTTDENTGIKFEIVTPKENVPKLNLTKQFSTKNMYLFSQGRLVKFDTTTEILDNFLKVRLGFYDTRKKSLTKELKKNILFLENKARFLTNYKITNKPKEYTLNFLKDNKYNEHNNSYDYLLNIPVYAFNQESVNEILAQLETKKKDLEKLTNSTTVDLYQRDLDALKKQLLN